MISILKATIAYLISGDTTESALIWSDMWPSLLRILGRAIVNSQKNAKVNNDFIFFFLM